MASDLLELRLPFWRTLGDVVPTAYNEVEELIR